MKSGLNAAVLVVLGAVLNMHRSVDATIVQMDLPYGESDLEPYISAEVGAPPHLIKFG